MPTGAVGPGRFIRYVVLDEDAAGSGYPFDLPVVDGLRRAWLTLGSDARFLVGENGSGKSTLVEGIAVAAGFNAEAGSRSFDFTTRSTESALGGALRVGRAPGRERTSFFLRPSRTTTWPPRSSGSTVNPARP